MARYQSKPVVIEATQWFGQNLPMVEDIVGERWDCPNCGKSAVVHGRIITLESAHSTQVCCPGDWIITGIKGEHYPCKPDVFAAKYQEAKPVFPLDLANNPITVQFGLENDEFYFLLGHNPKNSIAGFGPTPEKAAANFYKWLSWEQYKVDHPEEFNGDDACPSCGLAWEKVYACGNPSCPKMGQKKGKTHANV